MMRTLKKKCDRMFYVGCWFDWKTIMWKVPLATVNLSVKHKSNEDIFI